MCKKGLEAKHDNNDSVVKLKAQYSKDWLFASGSSSSSYYIVMFSIKVDILTQIKKKLFSITHGYALLLKYCLLI